MSESEEGFDVCARNGFQKLLEENPDLILLVTKKGCGLCPTLREAAYKLSEEKGVALAEMEFKPDASGACEVLDEDLKLGSDVGVAVVFKGKKEVGRVKSTGFKEYDEKHVKELLEKQSQP